MKKCHSDNTVTLPHMKKKVDLVDYWPSTLHWNRTS